MRFRTAPTTTTRAVGASEMLGRATIAVLVVALLSSCSTGTADGMTSGKAVADTGRVMSGEFADLANAADVEKIVSADAGESVPWAVIASDPGSPSLFIAYVNGATKATCGGHLGTAVVETSKSVTIAALSSNSSAPADCLVSPVVTGGRVELGAPLGDRELRHSVLSAPWDSAPSPLETEPAPTAAPTPTAVPYAGTATCANLLDRSTIASLSAAGLTDDSVEWSANIAKQPELLEFGMVRLGGILCDWRDGPTTGRGYGYGPISAPDATAMKAKLTALEYDLHTGSDGITRASDTGSGRHVFAFGDGFWAIASDTGESGEVTVSIDHVLADVIANAPAFR